MKSFGKSNAERGSYSYASSILTLVSVLGMLNMVFELVGADRYFPFSVVTPYILTVIMSLFTEATGSALFVGFAVVVGGIMCILVLLSGILSKKKSEWLVTGLVLYIIDCVGLGAFLLLGGFSAGMILDIIVHIVVLVILISGIKSYDRPQEESPEEKADRLAVESGQTPPETQPLRAAEQGKYEEILNVEHNGMQIVFRRLKKTTELVINGSVYAEKRGEPKQYKLFARVNGEKITVVSDAYKARVYLYSGDTLLAEKLRVD